MSSSILKRFLFGDSHVCIYEFKVHTYVVSVTHTVSTIMLNSTNVQLQHIDLVRQNIPGLVQFLAELCVEYNAHYDGFHNQLEPLSYEESENIVGLVNSAIHSIKNQ